MNARGVRGSWNLPRRAFREWEEWAPAATASTAVRVHPLGGRPQLQGKGSTQLQGKGSTSENRGEPWVIRHADVYATAHIGKNCVGCWPHSPGPSVPGGAGTPAPETPCGVPTAASCETAAAL